MFCKKYLDTLYDLNKYFEPQTKQLNIDFLTLFNHYIIIYSRNVFKFNSNWKKMKPDFSVDYEYIKQSNCGKDLLYIQKMLRFYFYIFKIDIQSKTIPTKINLMLYETFLKEEIYIFVNKIIKPFPIKLHSIREIIEKYNKYIKKSPKLNYNVLKELGIEV
jgi:hypothetical protein